MILSVILVTAIVLKVIALTVTELDNKTDHASRQRGALPVRIARARFVHI